MLLLIMSGISVTSVIDWATISRVLNLSESRWDYVLVYLLEICGKNTGNEMPVGNKW